MTRDARTNAKKYAGPIVILVVLALVVAGIWAGIRTLGRIEELDASLTEKNAELQEKTNLYEQALDANEKQRLEAVEASGTIDGLRSEVESATAAIESLKALLFDLSQENIGLKAKVKELTPKAVPQTQKAPTAAPQAQQTSAASSTAGWSRAYVSWYGPGLYGNHVAWSKGGYLTPETVNFAHLTMAFGTRVEFRYNGRTVVATCTDRGPHIAGRVFDLGPGTAKALGFSGVGYVEWRAL